MHDQILSAIKDANLNSDPPPANEAETCNRVIYPLLLAAGYSHLDIRSQDSDTAKGKPDYTILPNDDENMWFLEAKAWRVSLEESHAHQSLNYVNTQGKRWVVLTNGRTWRLYDNHIIGKEGVKLVAEFDLKDAQFAGLLTALAKSSVIGKKLEPFVQNQRLYSTLAAQLSEPGSDVVKAVTKVVKALPGMNRVTSAEIVGFFRSSRTDETHIEATSSAATTPHVEAQGKLIPLKEVTPEHVTGRRPVCLTLADGKELRADNWKRVSVLVAEHCLNLGLETKAPIFSSPKAKSPLFDRTGSSESARMREPVELQMNGGSFLVETHFSAVDHRKLWLVMFNAVGETLDGATLEVAE